MKCTWCIASTRIGKNISASKRLLSSSLAAVKQIIIQLYKAACGVINSYATAAKSPTAGFIRGSSPLPTTSRARLHFSNRVVSLYNTFQLNLIHQQNSNSLSKVLTSQNTREDGHKNGRQLQKIPFFSKPTKPFFYKIIQKGIPC